MGLKFNNIYHIYAETGQIPSDTLGVGIVYSAYYMKY